MSTSRTLSCGAEADTGTSMLSRGRMPSTRSGRTKHSKCGKRSSLRCASISRTSSRLIAEIRATVPFTSANSPSPQPLPKSTSMTPTKLEAKSGVLAQAERD